MGPPTQKSHHDHNNDREKYKEEWRENRGIVGDVRNLSPTVSQVKEGPQDYEYHERDSNEGRAPTSPVAQTTRARQRLQLLEERIQRRLRLGQIRVGGQFRRRDCFATGKRSQDRDKQSGAKEKRQKISDGRLGADGDEDGKKRDYRNRNRDKNCQSGFPCHGGFRAFEIPATAGAVRLIAKIEEVSRSNGGTAAGTGNFAHTVILEEADAISRSGDGAIGVSENWKERL